MIYQYAGENYPVYLKQGNAAQFIAPVAKRFCLGHGLDIGCGAWPLEGALGVDLIKSDGHDAMNLPERDGGWDFVFSSHCLEHLIDPVAAIEHWKSKLRSAGVLFLHLPHPTMTYWLPQNCRKHLHSWQPGQMAKIVRDVGFRNVLCSERDMSWSFSVVGWKGA